MSNLLPFVAMLHGFATDLTFLSFSEESISRVCSSVIKRQSASSLPVDLLYFLNSVFLVFFVKISIRDALLQFNDDSCKVNVSRLNSSNYNN